MAASVTKYHGAIGYGQTIEKNPGVWVETIIEKTYKGDVLRAQARIRDGENLNSNIVADNRISVLADPFAYQNYHSIRYVTYLGAKWSVSSVEVQRPRLILTMGAVYNEQTTGVSSDTD